MMAGALLAQPPNFSKLELHSWVTAGGEGGGRWCLWWLVALLLLAECLSPTLQPDSCALPPTSSHSSHWLSLLDSPLACGAVSFPHQRDGAGFRADQKYFIRKGREWRS